jgi:shikimate dehydrogenase
MTSYVALYGDPVEGNPTSKMHNPVFEELGLDWRYLDIHVRAEDLPAAVTAARVLGFAGLNLTIPHKVAVVPLLDELERSAEVCGAVNTVRRDTAGRLIGLNTDGVGFLRAIQDAGVDPRGLDVVLLGAGGAARAIGVELAFAGVRRITVANRTAARREALVALLSERTSVEARALPWEGTLAVPACDLVVDCTPVGMGSGDAARQVVDVDLAAVPAAAYVCDINPDRADTAFLEVARAAGHPTLAGMPMIARQGAAGFEAWTGVAPPLEMLEAALAKSAQEAEGDPDR